MDAQERKEFLDELLNPTLPDMSISFETGMLYRDLPPRRSWRERLRTLLRRQPKA